MKRTKEARNNSGNWKKSIPFFFLFSIFFPIAFCQDVRPNLKIPLFPAPVFPPANQNFTANFELSWGSRKKIGEQMTFPDFYQSNTPFSGQLSISLFLYFFY